MRWKRCLGCSERVVVLGTGGLEGEWVFWEEVLRAYDVMLGYDFFLLDVLAALL